MKPTPSFPRSNWFDPNTDPNAKVLDAEFIVALLLVLLTWWELLFLFG